MFVLPLPPILGCINLVLRVFLHDDLSLDIYITYPYDPTIVFIIILLNVLVGFMYISCLIYTFVYPLLQNILTFNTCGAQGPTRDYEYLRVAQLVKIGAS